MDSRFVNFAFLVFEIECVITTLLSNKFFIDDKRSCYLYSAFS